VAVYFVVNSHITDPDQLAEYRSVVGPTFEGHDYKLLVSYDESIAIEGTPAGERTVVLEFPDREAFEAWYHSDAYQAIIDLRRNATEGFAVLAEGR